MEKLEYKNSPVLGFILNSKYYLYDRYSNSIFTVPRIFFEYLDDLISLDTDEFTQKYHNIFSKEEIIDLFKTLDYCQNDKKHIIGIIVQLVRHNKVIPSYKPERYNIIEVNDYAD